jgi:tRNA (cmo5U34)-methyltransferase
MKTLRVCYPLHMKSSPEQIRERFDRDVERFSDLETGQSATIDARLVLDLIAKAAAATNPEARRLLDIGCGAGNYTLRLLQNLRLEEITLIDLSRPMLARGLQRISQVTGARIHTHQVDVRDFAFADDEFEVVVAAAVLHHLREEQEWEAVFGAIYRSLKPGGCFWVADLVEHSDPAVQAMMWERYGEYLTALKGPEYRQHVFAYIDQEDTPRSLMFQLDLLRQVGFSQVEVLHKNGCFAAFGAIK